MVHRSRVTDDWKRNWQQSIAIKISGVVLWIVMPIVLVTSSILLGNQKEEIAERYQQKADLLLHHVVSTVARNPGKHLNRLKQDFSILKNNNGFEAITVILDGDRITVGALSESLQSLTRSIDVGSHGGGGMGGHGHEPAPATGSMPGMLTLIAYHIPASELAKKERKHILLPVILGFLLFGVFLIWAIRTIVHKPLQQLVDATRAVSAGDYSVRVNIAGQDEFSSLSTFFNTMLDDLVHHQQQLQEAAQEAQEASKAKSAFLANMSHELRTPLNAIIGYSEMIAEELESIDVDGQSQTLGDLERIRTAGKHLLNLINNVLDLSKIEAGKIEAFIEPISISSLLQEVRHTVHPLMTRNRNNLAIEINSEINIIYSDLTKLKQILLNLLSNAAKFTRDGKVVLAVDLKVEQEREWFYFSVSDTGIGMTEQQMTQVFTEFSQADSSTTRRFGGTGLGLAIAEHFALFLGGEITVESVVGRGTTFHIRLPLKYDSSLSKFRPAKVTVTKTEPTPDDSLCQQAL